jgi:hypothetical protein
MNKRFITITVIIVAAAVSRILPHAPNFTPIGAMALFAGAYISNRYLALLIPALAMLLSDALMGFKGWMYTEQIIAVYSTFALITFIGMFLNKNKGAVRVGGASLASSVIFFLITNFAVWLGGFSHTPALYELNGAGLAQCYVSAIPFFSNTLFGDLFFSAVLFGGFYLLQINIPSLKEERVKA